MKRAAVRYVVRCLLGAAFAVAGTTYVVAATTDGVRQSQERGSDRSGTVPAHTGARTNSEVTEFVLRDSGSVHRADRAEAKLLRVSDLDGWSVASNPSLTGWPGEAYVWVVKVEGAVQNFGSQSPSDWLVRIFGGSRYEPLGASYAGLGDAVPGWDSLPDRDPNG